MNALSIVMLPLTRCDLGCTHCFEDKDERAMTGPELRRIFGEVRSFSEARHIDTVSFYWQGGEVFLLGKQWFEEMLSIQEDVLGPTAIHVRQGLQTHLLGYTSEWAPLVIEHFSGELGSSLDYPNKYRGRTGIWGSDFNRAWKDSYSRALADGLRVGVICVVNDKTIACDPREFLDFYANQIGVAGVQLNFPFATTKGKYNPLFFLDPEALGAWLGALYDEWRRGSERWHERLSIEPFAKFESALALARGPARPTCIWTGRCSDEYLSIAPDGTVGLCDCWVTSMPDFDYGNIYEQSLEQITRSPVRLEFQQRLGRVLDDGCAECEYVSLCYGGCPVRSYGAFQDIHHKDPYCEAYKAMFRRIEARVTELDVPSAVRLPVV